ncbi:MAG: hypothetical protein H0T62_10305 [Parachlamydiaceae bacterium]|nr:hypothetical protein [Parachlamydiaceae bacterium]
MNNDFSSLDYALDHFDIYQGDKFNFEKDVLKFTTAGFSATLIRSSHDKAASEYDCDSVAAYFSLLSDKIELAVIVALKESGINSTDFKHLRDRIVNLCWILEDLDIVSKEMEAGKPFKENVL